MADKGEDIAIFIRHDGVGLDMTYANKLFRVFQRLNREEKFEAIGIGLVNVPRFVERHGGRPWSGVVLGQGPTFFS